MFVEKKIYKMQHLEGSGTPVLYIGRTVLKGEHIISGRYLTTDGKISALKRFSTIVV